MNDLTANDRRWLRGLGVVDEDWPANNQQTFALRAAVERWIKQAQRAQVELVWWRLGFFVMFLIWAVTYGAILWVR